MKIKNKFFGTLQVFSVLAAGVALTGCNKPVNNARIKIVTTIFPQYDWVKNVVGDAKDISVTYLCNSGIDLHSYEPSPKDILDISKADLFIYTGGESDEWAEDALENVEKDLKVINLLEALGEKAKPEEIVEGMEGEEEEEEEEEEEIEYDEHVWLSLKNASLFIDEIVEKLSEIDSENAETYQTNGKNYKTSLNTLDEKYTSMVNESSKNTVLFGDRFPFRYLVDDYNLKYYAAFVGCSAEVEASAETIKFLANKVDELSLKVILTLEGGNKNIALTIKESSSSKDQQILEMNSLQSIKQATADGGLTYLSAMNSNFEVLKEALK